MVRLTSLEVYNSIFNETGENNKLEFYKFLDSKSGGISYERVRGDIEKDLEISDFTATDLEDKIISRINIEEHRKKI